MNYIKGLNREQLELVSLEGYIDEENEVRVIDAIAENMNIKELGIKDGSNCITGRARFNPKDLIKLYIYGYLNGIRSSRQLEKQARINLEVKWLMKGLEPKHTAISDFRKDNIDSFEKIFKELLKTCDGLDLIGKELVAIDGTKIRANAAKSKHYSKKKLEIIEELVEEKIKEYMELLEKNDSKEAEIKKKLGELEEKKKRYQEIKSELEKTETNGLNVTDPDAKRMQPGNTKGTIIGYNVQTAVDEKNKLIINYDVKSNPVDQGLLYEEAKKAKDELCVESLEILADKAYYKNKDIISCEENGIITYVPKVITVGADEDSKYVKEDFSYKKDTDTYVCPKGKELYNRSKREDKKRNIYYNYDACKNCENKDKCTSAKYGRQIERDPKEEILEIALERLKENYDKYKKRQMIVEHPFGTLKRAMRFDYFLLRGIKAVSGEIGLAFFCYNLKRLMNIKGKRSLVDLFLSYFINIFDSVLQILLKKIQRNNLSIQMN